MTQLSDYLRSVSRHRLRPPGASSRQRVLAVLLSAMLALSGALPGAALAGEVDSEGEGSAPPDAVSEVGEDPNFDPGGEDTALEGLPPASGVQPGGDAEDTGEGPPVEAEPQQDPEAPLPALEATGAAPDGIVEGEESAVAEVPAEQAVAAKPQLAPPPEPTVPRSSAPVENQPLIAPPAPPSEPSPAPEPVTAQVSAEASPPIVPAEGEVPPPRPVSTAVERENGGESLAARDFHTVRPGESLWSVATALLPTGAGSAEIAREVQRLWRLNESHIGTGDPDMLMVGTVLRLR